MRSFVNKVSSAAVIGVLCGSPFFFSIDASAADLTIRLAWYMPPHTTVDNQGNAIAKAIETMSGGKIKVNTYPGGSLLTSATMADGLKNNTANMGIFGMQWWAQYEPSLSWDSIRYLIKDPAAVQKALHGELGELVNKKFEKHGVKAIAWGYYGYADDYLNSKRAIEAPSDLKGLKLRSMGDVSAAFIKAEGGSPTAISSGEVYTAMQRGTIDGGASGISSFTSRKWYEVGKYITAFHATPVIYPVQVSQKWWNSLTSEQRDIIQKAAQSTELGVVSSINEEYESGIKEVEKSGVHVYRPTGENLEKWEKSSHDIMTKAYLKRSGEQGQEILNVFHKVMDGKQ